MGHCHFARRGAAKPAALALLNEIRSQRSASYISSLQSLLHSHGLVAILVRKMVE